MIRPLCWILYYAVSSVPCAFHIKELFRIRVSFEFKRGTDEMINLLWIIIKEADRFSVLIYGIRTFANVMFEYSSFSITYSVNIIVL